MCLAKAFSSAEKNRSFLENITYMKLDGDSIQVETMFGEERVIQGRVLEVDFEHSTVIIDPSNTPENAISDKETVN